MKQRWLILGLGVSGRSAAEYLYHKGVYVIGVDKNAQALHCPFVHECYAEQGEAFPNDIQAVVRSPGIAVTHPWCQYAYAQGIPIMTDIELAAQDPMWKQDFAIGITGSNGKTTTALFLAHLLNGYGLEACVVGNIGNPVLQNMHHHGIRIIELSSYQLAGIAHHQPILRSAVILNLAANHLDYHGNLEQYAQAKARIRKLLPSNYQLWTGPGISCSGKSYLEHSKEIRYALDKEDALKPIYLHDIGNYCAAYLLAKELAPISFHVFVQAVRTFKKPPHRIEYVSEKQGIHYVNDSKSTTVHALKTALISLKGTIVLIAGGRNKGGCFSSLLPLLKQKVKHLVVMGESRQSIAQALPHDFPLTVCESLKEAMRVARRFAQSGDTILLSPGCASVDQFRNFEERGNCFKQLVGDLEV